MAEINFTRPSPRDSLRGSNTIIWSSVTGSDTCTPYNYAKFSDKTVQMVGTFGDTVTMQGSNDGTNWFTLTDNQGSDIALTAAAGKLIAENPRFIRPSPGGSITSVTIIIQATEA